MKLKELENVNVAHKEFYINVFESLVRKIRNNQFDFNDDSKEKYIIANEIRLNSHFVHIVPRELIPLFNKVRWDYPEDFLGFSVLVGKRMGTEVRVCCFGIPCSLLTKSLIR